MKFSVEPDVSAEEIAIFADILTNSTYATNVKAKNGVISFEARDSDVLGAVRREFENRPMEKNDG